MKSAAALVLIALFASLCGWGQSSDSVQTPGNSANCTLPVEKRTSQVLVQASKEYLLFH